MKPSQLAILLQAAINDRAPVLITGAPGVGKSDIAAQAAEAAGAEFILTHPVISDPTDYKGMPAIDAAARVAKWIPFGDLHRLVTATRPTVFMLDDLGQAPRIIKASAMQLLLARRLNEYRIADCVTMLAATNRRTDRADVEGMLEPMKSRFATIVNLEADLQDWKRDFAFPHGIRDEIISFLDYQPQLLHAFKPTADLVNTPSPRTWANLNRVMGWSLPRDAELEAFSGAVGEAAATTFVGFLRICRDLTHPDTVLRDPDHAPIPADPATLYAMACSLAYRASLQTIDPIIRYLNRIPADVSAFAVNAAVRRCPAVVNTTPFRVWAQAHTDILF